LERHRKENVVSDDLEDPRVQAETLYWIGCTVCGPDGEIAPPRFTSEIEMWNELLRPSLDGWIRLDDGRILCSLHRRMAECDLDGHQMTPWTEHPLDDELDWRYCHRCGANFEQRTTAPARRAGS
jgi:hypothetical protein